MFRLRKTAIIMPYMSENKKVDYIAVSIHMNVQLMSFTNLLILVNPDTV